MPRTVEEIDAEMAALKVAGEHGMSAKMRGLRAERLAITNPTPVAPEPPAPLSASDDVTFINEALAQLLLKGNGKVSGKAEQSYSDVRALLDVKHILEDAAGLRPANRVTLPHWSTLRRERDSGLPFRAGEDQATVDGLAQRAVPQRLTPSRPTITAPDGSPITLSRSRIDEPEGAATFVGQTVGLED